MTSTENVARSVGMYSMIDALRDWIRTASVSHGHDGYDNLISAQQAFEAGWQARGHTRDIKREIIPDQLKNIEEDFGGLPATSVIPPTPVPPAVPWTWTLESDGSRTLHTTFATVKDEHPSGKKTVDIHMNMLAAKPFSTAAAIGAALAAQEALAMAH